MGENRNASWGSVRKPERKRHLGRNNLKQGDITNMDLKYTGYVPKLCASEWVLVTGSCENCNDIMGFIK
jgi:hypothetical protein